MIYDLMTFSFLWFYDWFKMCIYSHRTLYHCTQLYDCFFSSFSTKVLFDTAVQTKNILSLQVWDITLKIYFKSVIMRCIHIGFIITSQPFDSWSKQIMQCPSPIPLKQLLMLEAKYAIKSNRKNSHFMGMSFHMTIITTCCGISKIKIVGFSPRTWNWSRDWKTRNALKKDANKEVGVYLGD